LFDASIAAPIITLSAKPSLPSVSGIAISIGFVTSRTAYRRNAVRRTMILRIDEIAVPPRWAGVPDFERDRMVSILDAIRHDRTLPPIEVVEAINNLYGHRLYHGRHRLAASIAVGFSLVPAVIVRDLDEIKHAAAMAPS
jgi:ParB-like nuclease domain